MRFARPLVRGTLLRRYKRFLADVMLDDGGTVVVAHCPNPGAMIGLAAAGTVVWLEPNDDPRRSLGHAWRLVERPDGLLIGIDTTLANRVVGEALRERRVPALAAYGTVRPEVRFGSRSRIDFLLSEPGLADMFLEVKNVHFSRSPRLAEFPDSVTPRGRRHLEALSAVVAGGGRGMMLYLVQRSDCDRLRLAADCDAAYAAAFVAARSVGVEAVAYGCAIERHGVTLAEAIAVEE